MSTFPFLYQHQSEVSNLISCPYTPCEIADPIGSIPLLATPSTGLSLSAADRLRNQK